MHACRFTGGSAESFRVTQGFAGELDFDAEMKNMEAAARGGGRGGGRGGRAVMDRNSVRGGGRGARGGRGGASPNNKRRQMKDAKFGEWGGQLGPWGCLMPGPHI